MFLVYIPISCIISDRSFVIYQFFAIIVFDMITNGAAVNPAVVSAVYLRDQLPTLDIICIFIGYAFAAFLAYPILRFVVPSNKLTGPEINVALENEFGCGASFAFETVSTFFFLLAVFCMPLFHDWLSRPFISTAFRVISIVGRNPTMNPMVKYEIYNFSYKI
jgi:glycerol uptake facilitator-like aquaporin